MRMFYKRIGYLHKWITKLKRDAMRQAEKMAGNLYEEVAFSHELVTDEEV